MTAGAVRPGDAGDDGPVRFGLVSTAAINDDVLAAVSTSALVDVIAVASRDLNHARAYASTRGIARAYGSYEDLFRDPDVEAAYISVPNHLHVDLTLRALSFGKHVVCEKPLTRSRAKAEQVFSAAETAGRLVTEAFMYRHQPQMAQARELVERGAVGRLRLVRSTFTVAVSDRENIRLKVDLDGGALMDVGTYCVSSARYFAGEPTSVFAHAVLSPDGVDVRMVGALRFPDDVLASFDCGLDLAVRDHIEIVGEHGSLVLEDPWYGRAPVIEHRRSGDVHAIQVPALNPYRLQMEDFAKAVRGRSEPLLGRDDAVGQADALEALYRSLSTGTAESPAGTTREDALDVLA